MHMYQNTYLMHHGVKGMHWGIRRYQNPDGTRTNAGKRHEQLLYKINEHRANRAAAKQAKKEARAEKRAKFTSPEAKEAYKKIAKGAAITAGILAAGYAAKIGIDELSTSRDIASVKKYTEKLMENHFKDLDEYQRSVIANNINRHNLQEASTQRMDRAIRNSNRIEDFVNAYLNPMTANVSSQNTYRTNRYTGKYSNKNKGFDPDAPFGTINESNLHDKYEQGLRKSVSKR